jgi:hypothetical protein
MSPDYSLTYLARTWNGRFHESGAFKDYSWYKNLCYGSHKLGFGFLTKNRSTVSLLTAYKLAWVMKNSSAAPKVEQLQMIRVQDIA